MFIYRIFLYIVIALSFSPFVLMANSNEQQLIIDKIIQNQTQLGKTVATNRSSSGAFVSEKIVGGSTPLRGRHPEFALLIFTDSFGNLLNFCGGTLISSNKVLTAAHCTFNYSTTRTFVIPNFYSFNDDLAESDIYNVRTKSIHPGYLSGSFDYDVSVLTLSRNISSATTKLFNGENLLTNYQATIVGVGTLSENGVAPDTLQAASVPVVSNPICRGSYGAVITDRMLCAGLISGGTDSCQGDSGGPLWVNFEGQKVQAGITSFGQGCARPNFYGVYSRISALNAFIRENAPNADFVAEAKISNIAFLQILLLDDDNEPPVCNHPINLGDTINLAFDQNCFDRFNSQYFKSFTFTIDQDSQTSIRALTSSNFGAYLRLYSGTQASGALLNSDFIFDNEAIIIDQLGAGTYTIQIVSANVNESIELSLALNDCQFPRIALNATVQSSFNSDCRSIGQHHHPYARYYTFTLNQALQINIDATSQGTHSESLSLFAGTDIFATPLKKSSFFSEAVLVENLNVGTYTIEVTSKSLDELIDLNVIQNNCQSTPIILNTTAQSNFSNNCRNISTREYASYHTFTLDQSQQITINSPISNDYAGYVRLFAGTDVSGTWIDSQGTHISEAILVNELAAGTYTIELTSSNVDQILDLELKLNQCGSSPISFNAPVQSNFNSDCRSIGEYAHPYAHYYTFTLNQAQQINLTAASQTDDSESLRLYAGTDVSAIPIKLSRFSNKQAALVMDLNTGTYTIEITSEDANELIDLNLIENSCQFSPISLNSAFQANFTSDCRSIPGTVHHYAHYYTFTLNQTQEINLSAASTTNRYATLKLFSGSDISATPIGHRGFFSNPAVLIEELNPGAYTIEVTSENLDELIDLSLM